MIAVLCACVLVTACAGAFAEDYTASAPGMGGDVPVTVSYEDGRITAVTVGENNETPGIGDQAINAIPGRIVEEQSLTVDTVAGATVTSNAILTAAEAALTAGGVDVTPFKQEKQPTELVEDYPDVSFIVLEKLDMVSGSLPASGGAIAGISSKYHVRDGVECTTKDFDVLFTYTSGTQVRTALVENVYAKSDVLLNRLIDYGTPFTGETEPASTYSDKVYAIRTENRGQSFADFLNSYVKENTFDLRMGTTATELIVEDGKVAGVVAEDDEQRYDIRAKAVILATGGFGSNPELMEEYLPLFADGVIATNAGATGDGILMTRQFGTKIVGDGSMGSIVAPDGSNLITANFLVNLNGERFVGEGEPKYVLQRAVSQQPEKAAFLIADANYADMDTIAQKIEKGYVKQYDTIEALAEDNGIDAEQFQKTIDAYNQAADAGEPIPALEYELAADKATKVETAPFYIEKVTLRTFGTIPGIEVNDSCQVLDGEGQVVEGLYASGELIAGNAFTRQYPGVGIGVSFAANSGRFAAETAAEGL